MTVGRKKIAGVMFDVHAHGYLLELQCLQDKKQIRIQTARVKVLGTGMSIDLFSNPVGGDETVAGT